MKQAALDYHARPKPGKISIELTKPVNTVKDLSLAYSPGVAEPVREIAADPENAYKYTMKGNLVAVITNGTAILGLGNLGPLASKPVMEGKALLFKRFAGIDAIDLEVNCENTENFIDTVKRVACSFGGINLEDIKAPECFEIERRLIAECNIPVFHDDQHGTAIVTTAGMLNALEIVGKTITEVRLVCLGAGSAAIACIKLLISCGMNRKKIFMLDSKGVIHTDRNDLNYYKAMFAVETDCRTLSEVIDGADVFLGLSGPDLLSDLQLKKMADNPIVFACANPDPEIRPEVAYAVRPDVIMATGRSDYPNQVNNILVFPFIFRGALDVRASRINENMKVAAVNAICALTKENVMEEIIDMYDIELSFGPDYMLPKPTDPRLLGRVSAAVAKAAVNSGVANLGYPNHYPLLSLTNI